LSVRDSGTACRDDEHLVSGADRRNNGWWVSAPSVFRCSLILIALPLTMLISLLAAWWPARKAVNLNVVEAIGYE
jgi:ABC-type antimicrobial peptide transport system permease subunit